MTGKYDGKLAFRDLIIAQPGEMSSILSFLKIAVTGDCRHPVEIFRLELTNGLQDVILFIGLQLVVIMASARDARERVESDDNVL